MARHWSPGLALASVDAGREGDIVQLDMTIVPAGTSAASPGSG